MPRPPKTLLDDDGDRLDVSQERAKLLRAQREHTLAKTAVIHGRYAPIADLERVLGDAVQAVCDRLDQLPAQLRTQCPDLPQAAVDRVMTTISQARAEWATAPLTLQVGADVEGDADAAD